MVYWKLESSFLVSNKNLYFRSGVRSIVMAGGTRVEDTRRTKVQRKLNWKLHRCRNRNAVIRCLPYRLSFNRIEGSELGDTGGGKG